MAKGAAEAGGGGGLGKRNKISSKRLLYKSDVLAKNSPAFKILCVSLGARHFWDGAFVALDKFRLKCKKGDGPGEEGGERQRKGKILEDGGTATELASLTINWDVQIYDWICLYELK